MITVLMKKALGEKETLRAGCSKVRWEIMHMFRS